MSALSKSMVQARLDDQVSRDLADLCKAPGLSPSEVVREAVRRMAATHPRPDRPRIAGLGQFASGISDLGSNKKHLKGFGK